MVINDDVAPGKKINGRILIANTGSTLMTVQISREMKIPFSSQTAKNNDWLKIKQNVVSLKPGEKKNIDYSLSAGRKDSGEAMAIIFFNEKGPDAAVNSRIGAVLYAKIKGTEIMDAEIEAIKIKKDELGAITVDLVMHNRGNVYVCPRGKLFIIDSSGERVDDIDIPYNTLILPGQTREIPVPLAKGKIYANKCNLEAVVDYSRDNNKILIRKKVSFVTD